MHALKQQSRPTIILRVTGNTFVGIPTCMCFTLLANTRLTLGSLIVNIYIVSTNQHSSVLSNVVCNITDLHPSAPSDRYVAPARPGGASD